MSSEQIDSLKSWLNNGWLVEHETSPQEVSALLQVVERDIEESRTPGLGADWRLAIAYNAALQAATLGLAASGFRASREAHHYRVIASLALTIGASPAMVARLDAFRKKRNLGGYERAGQASDGEADEMRELAVELKRAALAFLGKHHKELLPDA